MATTKSEHLCVAAVPIFKGLPHAQLEQIEALVQHRHFAANSTLYLENSPADALYILHAGSVKILRSSADGRQQLLRVLHSGDFDGDQGLLMDQQHQAEAVAMAPVTACVLYKKDFQALLEDYPAIAKEVIASLAHRIAALETQTTLVTTTDVATRLAHYLNELTEEFGPTFTLPMKKKELAEFLGTTPETLSRKLRELESAKVLTQGPGRKVTILDRDALVD
ncbi:Crp/Fnr family transcriptional regulator [Lacticaseibacillus porcinae]|uniref:Crp/Fnr family transcriptional regulator n=1 Tax=Lacticaseibacillus porcinae TaxID=1123687 RepID=UPI0013DE4F1A|nr:Crp/Fnr family transcriptional regulator [Lacticaseibacillus porcinae]